MSQNDRLLSVVIDRPVLSDSSIDPFLRRERIPFYRRKGWPYKRERVRVRVCALVLSPTPSGTRWIVGAHNTFDAQMHVVGTIVFFWYGKCWSLPYCRTNVGAHNIIHVLTSLEVYKVSF